MRRSTRLWRLRRAQRLRRRGHTESLWLYPTELRPRGCRVWHGRGWMWRHARLRNLRRSVDLPRQRVRVRVHHLRGVGRGMRPHPRRLRRHVELRRLRGGGDVWRGRAESVWTRDVHPDHLRRGRRRMWLHSRWLPRHTSLRHLRGARDLRRWRYGESVWLSARVV